MDEPTVDDLPLGQAIVAWADTTIIEEMRNVERGYTKGHLLGWRWPRLVPDSALRPATNSEWMAGGGDPTYVLKDVWRKVELQLKRSLREEKLYLSGVMVRPELTTVSIPVPGVWASELKFDLVNDVVEFGKHRYAAVRLSKSAPNQPVAGEASTSADPSSDSMSQITAENVGQLTDERVMWLLEDYARRVVEHPGAKIFPTKISHMPIILRMMRYRAEQGQLLPTRAEESRELAEWIKTKLPSHQVLKAETIENNIRAEYPRLWALSKTIKP